MRILLVEDDPMIAESAAESLREEGHDVQRVSDGRNAMAQLKVHGYDFVLLDLGLPGADGMTVLRTLRAAKNTTPVIILTARDALDDRLAGLDAGADDYVVKPFHMSEILARMRAVQRRRFGFEADGIEEYLSCWRMGDIKEQLTLLSRQRAVILDRLHREEKQIDCLDYLVYQIGKGRVSA